MKNESGVCEPQHGWWQKPMLHFEEEQGAHRKVAWIELFYDLVFVVAIAQIAHQLAAHLDWAGAGTFLILFLPVWWTWISGTVYNERFESRGIENRVFFLSQMITVGGLAFFAHHGTGHNSTGFALSFVVANLIIQVLWIRGGIHNPAFRPVMKRYLIGFLASIALWVVSIWVPAPFKFVLWGAGVAGMFITPMFTLNLQEKLPRFSSSKMPERYGLFTIIVLGEAIVGSINGMAAHEHLHLGDAIVGALGIALAFSLWWIYFDFIARRVPRPRRWNVFLWGAVGHTPMVLGLVATGAALLNVVAHSNHEQLPREAQLLLGFSIALSLISIAFIETRLARHAHEPTHPWLSPAMKVLTGLAIAGVAIAPLALPAIAFMLILLGLLGVNMAYGAWSWFRKPEAHDVGHYVG
ncbi:MAG: low temperature requirement protein A [Planctomycetes bacterium]|nr:low temperature requirement protein A [Planctomycetota bacterium]